MMDKLAEEMVDELQREPADEEVFTRYHMMCQTHYWRSIEAMIAERLGK